MKKYIVTIIFLFVIIALLIGGYFLYSNAKIEEGNSVGMLRNKCNSELKYLSSNIILMMNEINNISYENYKVVNDKINVSNSNEKKSQNDEQTQEESGMGGGSNVAEENNR